MSTAISTRPGAARPALCAAALLAALMAVPARMQAAPQATVATDWVGLHGSRVRLIAGPGAGGSKTYLAGVELVLADGWKTYWRMPGDAGVPPQFDWTGSANTATVKVLYPAPMRLVEPAAETIGYKGSIIFPVEVRPVDPAKPVELSLALELGICREICIPGEAKLSLSIPSTGLSGESPILEWRARVPRLQSAKSAGDPELKRVVATLDGPAAKLLVEASFPRGAKAGDIFIEAPDGLYVPMAKRIVDGPGGLVRFESDLSRIDPRDLKGKELTLTLVGDGGASTEATWRLP